MSEEFEGKQPDGVLQPHPPEKKQYPLFGAGEAAKAGLNAFEQKVHSTLQDAAGTGTKAPTGKTGARPDETESEPQAAVRPGGVGRSEFWLPFTGLAVGLIFLFGIFSWLLVHRYAGQIAGLRGQIEQNEKDKKALAAQLEESSLKLHNVQIGTEQMKKLFDTIGTPPPKPQYERTSDGIIVYWLDGMLWRRYHLYQAIGKKSELKKVNKRSTQKNFVMIKNLRPGVWRFAVTALDREGQETKLSDELEIKF